MNLVKLAWRNVWRNSRRSLITIVAMTLALWVELLYSGMMQGMLVDMSGDVTQYDMGDVQVYTNQWEKRPSLHEAVPDAAEILGKLDAAGLPATPRLQAGGLAASGELSSGVLFVGIDPIREPKVLDLDEAVAEGQWLDPSDSHGIVVGRGLARTLGLSVGSEVVALSQAADGTMANDLFKVRGILLPVAASTDRSAVMMTEGAFRELFVFPTGAHRILVKAPPEAKLEAVSARVAALAPGATTKTWKQINPFVAQMLDAAAVQMSVIYFVLYLAVAILVVNAMLMAVFERIREFGVLKAIGYGPGQVLVMMLLEGMFQAVVAAVVGGLAAIPFMIYFQTVGVDVGALGGVSMMGMAMPTIWHGEYTLAGVKTPFVMLFVIVFFAVLYPALKAAWIRPVEAIQHQ